MLEIQNCRQEKKSKREKIWKNVCSYFSEFCNNTSLHGFKYLGKRNVTICERLIWLLAITFSMCLCIHFVSSTYNKWKRTPVMISLATSPLQISDIPFPAVTICPLSQAKQTAYNYSHYFQKFISDNITDKEFEMLEKVGLICDRENNLHNFTFFDLDVYDILSNVTFSVEESVRYLQWNMLYLNRDAFTPIILEDGICFTFNMIPREELFKEEVYRYYNPKLKNYNANWSIEKGFPENFDFSEVPRRVAMPGFKYGLKVLLSFKDEDLDYLCGSAMQGYKVILHEPGEIPRSDLKYFIVPLDQVVTVSVRPKMIKTSDYLKSYGVEKRQCVFSDENDLDYFKVYTQQNCELECISKLLQNFCDCVPFYMPFFKNNRTKICGPKSIDCIRITSEYVVLGNGIGGPLVQKFFRENCDCPPSCYTLSYNAETSQNKFEHQKYIKILKDIDLQQFFGYHLTFLHIFFKEPHFLPIVREELYGVTDFLSNCGGIFGLLTGFSFLSMVEVLYYLTVRAYCAKCSRKISLKSVKSK